MLAGQVGGQPWSSKATSVLRNLTTKSIPLLVDATLDLIRERALLAADVVLPRPRRKGLAEWLGGSERGDAYVRSKRGALDAARVEAIIDGCRAAGLGTARVSALASTYVVVEPA
jgi:hypothetical protein